MIQTCPALPSPATRDMQNTHPGSPGFGSGQKCVSAALGKFSRPTAIHPCFACGHAQSKTNLLYLSDLEDVLKNIPYLEQPLARAITGHGGPLGFRLLLTTSGRVRFWSFLSMSEKSYCSLVTCSFISEKATGDFKLQRKFKLW